MKQVIIVIPLFGILLFILHLFATDLTRVTEPAAFLSDDVLAVARQYDLEDRIDQFRTTPLGRALAGIDYAAVARDLGFPETDIDRIAAVRRGIGEAVDNPVLRLLFGREVTVALYPFTGHGVTAGQGVPLDAMLFISRPRRFAKLVDLVTRLLPAPASYTESSYGGHVIKRFPLDERGSVAAVRVRDLLLFSSNERLLRRSLDTYDTAEHRLSASPEYRRTAGQFAAASSFAYVNLAALTTTLAGVIEDKGGTENQLLEDQLLALKGFNSLFFGRAQKRNQLTDKLIIRYDRDEIESHYRELFDIGPVMTTSHQRVAADTICFYWTNGLRPQVLLKLYERQRARYAPAAAPDDFLSRLETITGSSGAELLALVKNDITIAVKEVPQRQFVPVPRLMVAVKIRDPARVKAALEKILAYYDIPINTKRVQGVEINSWGGIIGDGDVQPTFALAGEHLIIASNRGQIREFIAAPGKTKSLDKSPQFKKIEDGVRDENNSFGYMQFAKLARMTKEIVNWGGTMLALADRQAAMRSKILLDRLVNPLLDGLSMYSIVGTRSYIEDDAIIMESTTIIESRKK